MTLLNKADQITLGTGQASAVYAGSVKVWPPFKPTNLAGCVIWIDAETLSYANRGSGPQPTIFGSPNPTFRANALNTIMPVLRITQGEGQLKFSGTGINADYTLVYVGRKWSLRPGRVVAADYTAPGNPNILWGFYDVGYDCAFVAGWFIPGPESGITATTAWRLYSGDAIGTGTARFFSDGKFLSSHPAPPPAQGFAGTLMIGGIGAGQEADSEIAEFVMYNRKLSDAERVQVENYLRIKWMFQPKNLTGLVVWLDASTSSLTNFGSGPQPTILGAPPPVFQPAALNGLSVVRITNGQGQVRFTGTGIDKDYTLIFLARKWRQTAGRVITADVTSSGANVLWGFHGNEFDSAYVEGWFNTPGPAGGITATTGWRLYSGDQTATGTARLFSNSALWGSHPTPPPTKGWGGTLNIGGWDAARTQEADSEIAEVLLYNRKLADDERQQVEGYLRYKWALPKFKPTDLGTNLLGWFDGADAASVQITGSGVSNWVNKGVSALTLTQGTDVSRPRYANSTVTFTTPQVLLAANSPATYDFVLVSRPNAAAGTENNWRTLLRNDAQGGHQIILEDHTTRMGTYYAGFQPAGGGFMSAMTSNTAPYTVVANSELTVDYQAFHAFDNNPATFWHSAGAPPGQIKIDIGAYPKFVAAYKYQVRNPALHSWKSWVLDGSLDDVNWVRVDTVNDEPNYSAGETRTYACDTPGVFRYFRWYVYTTWSGSYVEAARLELFSSTSETALTWDTVWGIGYGRIADITSMSRDGGPLIATAASTPAGNANFHSLGGYSGGTQAWGDIKEVIIVPYNFESHRQTLEGYLAHKWGLTALLPANHPYKATPP